MHNELHLPTPPHYVRTEKERRRTQQEICIQSILEWPSEPILRAVSSPSRIAFKGTPCAKGG